MSIEKHLSNVLGLRTNRKIVVFEIDDYGTSKLDSQTVDYFDNENIPLDYFSRYDRMATANDLSSLFEVLNSVKDKNGKPAVFTPLTIVANPDYDKIRKSDFQNYYYEPFTETLKKTVGNDVFNIWKQGIDAGIFMPQFHGREHFNLNVWMSVLQNPESNARKAFNRNVFGIFDKKQMGTLSGFGAAFDFLDDKELIDQEQIIKEGISVFKEIFNYSPVLFTPPNSRLSTRIEDVLVGNGIKYLTVSKKRIEPLGDGKTDSKFTFFGKIQKSGLMYTPRNCQFEPHNKKITNPVASCLKEISIAFAWNKPAIVSAHRINFVNQDDPHNGNGIKKLDELLKQIVAKWPNVEFMSSEQLYNTIKK